MDDSLEGLLPSPPAGYRWHDTLAFGFAIAVPRRFHLLTNTFDPIARDLRHIVDDEDEPRGADGEALWADGVWDPEVIDELSDRRVQPTRIFEFDVVGPRPEPMPPDMQREMWFQSRQMFPSIMESGELPGYRLLDISMLRLGELDALGFEYWWDGLCLEENGGDHALLVWAPTSRLVFHVYHHCAEDEWTARRTELDEILGTFRLISGDDGASPPS